MKGHRIGSAVALALVTAVLSGCAGSRVEVEPLMRDFARFEKELQSAETEREAKQFLDTGIQKRTEAEVLLENGKEKAAYPVMRKALADARVALDVENMRRAARRAESCRLQVEQARQRWQDALFVLEQTEGFTGRVMPVARNAPAPKREDPALPPSTLGAVQPQEESAAEVLERWKTWHQVATDHGIATADLESDFFASYSRTQGEGVKEHVVRHFLYLASRTIQSLECRIRQQSADQTCLSAADLATRFGQAQEEFLRATLDLERSLQDDLRRQLDDVRAEAQNRQSELFEALSAIEGKFASIRQDARGTIVSLADILFDFDKATLKRDVEFNLVKVATILNQFSEMGILIEGHTDDIGSEEYNLDLSKRRAKAVYDFLISQGVAEKRMMWDGYGESRPVADNGTEEGRQKNRRVDLVIQDAQ